MKTPEEIEGLVAKIRAANKARKRSNAKAWYKKNRAYKTRRNLDWWAVNTHRRPRYHFKYEYDITVDYRNSIIESQNNCCAICGTDKPGGRHNVLHIDHCHDTDSIRGALCDKCNRGLGMFNHSPERMRRAAEYIENARIREARSVESQNSGAGTRHGPELQPPAVHYC